MEVIVLGDKYGQQIIKYCLENLRAIILDRFEKGYYDGQQEYEEAEYIVLNDVPEVRLQRFLYSRSDAEYESFNIEKVEDSY